VAVTLVEHQAKRGSENGLQDDMEMQDSKSTGDG
jgi:hypothetical protein